MTYIKKLIILGGILLFASACDKVYLDPNSTLEPDVVNSTDNLVALINGVQQRWSTDRAGLIYTSTHITGLNTGELRLLNPGNLGENEVLLGGDNIDGGNELLNNMWTNAMLCRKEATTVITSADNAASDESAANSLKAYGLFYRALVHGTLIQYFESIPIEIIEDAAFESRSEVLQSAIADLNEANLYIQVGLSSEITAGLFSSVDLENSVNALLARFHLMLGNYDAAIQAADAVDLSVKSTWEYDAAIPNPLAFWFGSQNVAQARDTNFALPPGLAPDENDERVPFYVTAEDFNVPSPNYQILGFFDDNLKQIPVFLPGEMLLIKAEAHARNGELSDAVGELDKVLTKTAAQDAFGVGANLPAYAGPLEQDAILDEIYRNRRIELYVSGLGLEDSRRFQRPGPNDANPERNKDYYPYPNAERDNNENTPPNPSS